MDTQRIDEVLELFQPDAARLELARSRQAAVWNNEPADYLPITFGIAVPERESYADLEFSMVDEYYNADVMLFRGLWGMIAVARSGSDSVPSIRANLGTAFVPTMFGLEQQVLPHCMPWLKQHLSKEQIERFEIPDDISQLGEMPRALEYYRCYQEKLGPGFTFVADTQSPFDIAHLVRGDDIFTDVYDDPAFVHHLLELTTEMYIRATQEIKRATGETPETGAHGNSLWMANGGVRACEDSSTLLSPALVDEFVIPYLERALEPFGGGWAHYCGNNDRLLNALIDDAPHVRGINFGNPERHDYAALMPRLLDTGKFYFGFWPREEGEDDRSFFGRILAPLEGEKRGLILQYAGETPTAAKAAETIDLWHELQG